MAAGVFGAVYLLVGMLGFIPFLGGSYGIDSTNLLGLFPVNAVHNLVHLGVGVAGLAAYSQGASMSRLFALGVGSVYAVLALVGLTIAGAGNFLGLVPLGGFDIALHAATAAALLLVGFSSAPSRTAAAA
jgi:hypothetical protein